MFFLPLTVLKKKSKIGGMSGMSGMSVENIKEFSSRFHPVIALLIPHGDEFWKIKTLNP